MLGHVNVEIGDRDGRSSLRLYASISRYRCRCSIRFDMDRDLRSSSGIGGICCRVINIQHVIIGVAVRCEVRGNIHVSLVRRRVVRVNHLEEDFGTFHFRCDIGGDCPLGVSGLRDVVARRCLDVGVEAVAEGPL